MSNWKRIDEELPKDSKDIIFLDINGFNSFGYYDENDGQFWEYHGHGYKQSEVVSWCYVPLLDVDIKDLL